MTLCILDGPVLADHDVAVLCAAVHKTSFLAPWSVESFAGLLRTQNVTVILLYSGQDQVVGLLLSQVLVDEAEILTFCVHPQFRRQGWGLKMLTGLCDNLRRKKVCAVFLEVAIDNSGAHGIYKAFGFQSIAKRKNYYSKKGRYYDADVMKIFLSQ